MYPFARLSFGSKFKIPVVDLDFDPSIDNSKKYVKLSTSSEIYCQHDIFTYYA